MPFLANIKASALLGSGGGEAVSLLAEAGDSCLQRGKVIQSAGEGFITKIF